MSAFDRWPFWARAVAVNLAAIAGIVIGFRLSDIRLSLLARFAIIVPVLGFVNYMMLVARPRIVAKRARI